MPSSNSRNLQVFLCHAKEDAPIVLEIYNRLKTDGIKPWFDEKDLLGGENWVRAITKAVKASDVIVVCLSQNLIEKASFVQREISLGLDIADQKPEGTIFLIPLRLSDCEIPARMSNWHWINYYESDGYEKLKRSLEARAKQLEDERLKHSLKTLAYERSILSSKRANAQKPQLTLVLKRYIESRKKQTRIAVWIVLLMFAGTGIISIPYFVHNYKFFQYVKSGHDDYQAGLYSEAEQQYKEALSIDPNNVDAYKGLGDVYCNQKRYPEAEQQFKLALILAPMNVDIYNSLADIYQSQKRYEDAEQQYKKAINIDSENFYALCGLGKVYYQQQCYDAAEHQFKQAVASQSGDIFLWENLVAINGLGDVYQCQKRYNEAQKLYKGALSLDANNFDALNGLANVYRKQKNDLEAAQQYKKALGIDPKSVDAWNGLGEVYYDQKQYSQAQEQYKKALSLNPKNVDALNGLALLKKSHDK